MREILFRGKDVRTGYWKEGSLVREWLGVDMGYTIRDVPDHFNQIAFRSIVDPKTIGEFSGLTDKNGKKIFEGDVLNVHDQIPMFDGYDTDEIVYNGKVMYIKNQGMYVCEGNNGGNALCALDLGKCEVIGNIHDNPELLEADK